MDIQKLQRAVIDALEDVKAQDIKVFNTTHLTSLFDRVVIASATSNRQTRALASSVADRGRAMSLTGITIEGEDTGEWVVVDLGDVVVHIMQPAIRQYYNLEEIWGGKPVRKLQLPRDVALVTILRGPRVIVPERDEPLEGGDELLFVAVTEAEQELRELLLKPQPR